MAKNVTDEVAETEIITVKMAETEEVVKSVENFRDFSGGTHPNFKTMHGLNLRLLNGLKWLEMHSKHNKSGPYYNVKLSQLNFL